MLTPGMSLAGRRESGRCKTIRLGGDLAGLGQDLFNPPTVRGWAGGTAWVNPGLLVGRQNLAVLLLSEAGPYAGKLDPATLAGKYGQRTTAGQAAFLIDLFVQGDMPENVRETLLRDVPAAAGAAGRWLRQLTHRLTALPEFQLA